MAYAPLRQPKLDTTSKLMKSNKDVISNINYFIVTLNNNMKLVVSSDAYHGIIKLTNSNKCLFCNTDINFNNVEKHKLKPGHCENAKKYPHLLEYGENLIRKIDDAKLYCTLCNVVVINITNHLNMDEHREQLEKALARAPVYKPLTNNKA